MREADIHRIRSGRVLPAVLPLLLAVWVLSADDRSAAAAEDSAATATTLPVAGANAVISAPYVSVGVALMRTQDTRFVGGSDAGHAALYGREELFDAGAVDDGLLFHVAAGVRLPYRLRAQLEFGAVRALDWRGNTNYRDSGRHQPTEASLDTRQLILAGFHDLPGWEIAPGRRARPYLGAGLGIVHYRLSRYVQRFPEPDDPHGYLRRGPGGEIPFTALPKGRGRNFTWMLTAGVAIPIGESIHLDLSYRYADAGEVRTDTGGIAVVRYHEDGTWREIPVHINQTAAAYRIHSSLAALRFEF